MKINRMGVTTVRFIGHNMCDEEILCWNLGLALPTETVCLTRFTCSELERSPPKRMPAGPRSESGHTFVLLRFASARKQAFSIEVTPRSRQLGLGGAAGGVCDGFSELFRSVLAFSLSAALF